MAMARRPLVAGNWKMNGRMASLSELDKVIAGGRRSRPAPISWSARPQP